MRILILGCGSAGSRHARNLLALGVAPEDVFGFDPHGWAEGWPVSCRMCRPREWALDNCDVVVIATPAVVHEADARDAIARGLPVYCEKPLSLAATPELQALVGSAADLPTFVGFTMRWHPIYRDARHVRAVATRIVCGSDVRTWPGESYADALLECSHEIDAALMAWGPGVCVGAAVTAHRPTAWDLLIRHDSGVVSSVHLNYCQTVTTRTLDVLGQCGEWRSYCASPVLSWDAAIYQPMLRHWLDCVRDGRQTVCPLSQGLAVLRLCDEARRLAAVPV